MTAADAPLLHPPTQTKTHAITLIPAKVIATNAASRGGDRASPSHLSGPSGSEGEEGEGDVRVRKVVDVERTIAAYPRKEKS